MFFLLSGEGPTDLGVPALATAERQERAGQYGPMAIIADRLVRKKLHYSILERGTVGFVTKQELISRAAEFKAAKKSLGIPGKKRAKETRYFFNNARALALFAKNKQSLLGDKVVAILFRDADGTATTERGEWETKWQSMLDGFHEEGFEHGVPMIPKPKSEAWLLCALKTPPYQNCSALESRSGNDRSPNGLKMELESLIGLHPGRRNLCQILEDRSIDVDRIDMPKFMEFRNRLEFVINSG
ncbi:MAG: hypothetical protein JWM11_1257 [Planctomycetaceae bacterium]|nr:hypothetical protein [Planctomycetaceae bacterium]